MMTNCGALTWAVIDRRIRICSRLATGAEAGPCTLPDPRARRLSTVYDGHGHTAI